MGSRWYRSPEIILLQPNYDSKFDIWSLGCIFAELCLTRIKNKKKVLFQGTSCFPLSEMQNKEQSEEKDQLFQILSDISCQSSLTLSTKNSSQSDCNGKSHKPVQKHNSAELPTLESFSFLDSKESQLYCEKLLTKVQSQDRLEKIRKFSPQATAIIERMLVFNPS